MGEFENIFTWKAQYLHMHVNQPDVMAPKEGVLNL